MEAQCESIRDILNSPASAATFTDLLYAVETAVQLGSLPEEEAMLLVQELFAGKDSQGRRAKSSLQDIRNRLIAKISLNKELFDDHSNPYRSN